MIDEYKETILHELENAVNEDEVKQIIDRSTEQFKADDFYRYLVIIYLHILQNEIEEVSEEEFDAVKKNNLRHALNYLIEMNNNRGKTE